MKKLFLSCLFAIFVTLSFSQSLLWKVTGGDLKQPSYLYGSIHIQDARVFAFDSTVVLGTLQTCDAFAMEILMDEIDPMELKKSQFMPKGKLLSKMMKPADFAKLDSVCKAKLGILKALEHATVHGHDFPEDKLMLPVLGEKGLHLVVP